MTTVQVDPGDPHNDQVLAYTAGDLKQHMGIVRHVLDQAEVQDAPLSAVVAAISAKWIKDVEEMPRERLASLLALALVQNHAKTSQAENVRWAEFIKTLGE